MTVSSSASRPWAVVLAGGVGSRFWPLSTPARPKQLLPLVDDDALLTNTLQRLSHLTTPEQMLILTNASLTPAIGAACKLPPQNILAEPSPAGTAAALTWAAHVIEQRAGPGATMVCVHADWAIKDPLGFCNVLARAAAVATERSSLVTVGIVPTRPDPGFGYIKPGTRVDENVFKVERFVEKPDRARAEQMIAEGCLWNSGIFAWQVGNFLDDVRAHTPEVAPALANHAQDAEHFFAAVQSVSVDVGVLERSSRVLVIPGDFGWDDVGTWASLRRVRVTDEAGNAKYGTVHTLDAAGNVVHAEGNAVVLYGVSDLVVVTRDGLTLVTTIDRSADLKTLVASLPASIRDRPS